MFFPALPPSPASRADPLTPAAQPVSAAAGPRMAEEESDEPPAGASSLLGSTYQERSAHLHADPKMRELKRYRGKAPESSEGTGATTAADMMKSSSTGTLTPAVSNPQSGSRPGGDNLRSEGREAIDRLLKRLASEKAQLPHIGPACQELPECFRNQEEADRAASSAPVTPVVESPEDMYRRLDRSRAKRNMRGHMDHMLNRMMIDLELARDERLKNYAHQARCDHLDRMYDWYQQHRMREPSSGASGPPYVKFRSDAFVMPGSMRVAPLTWSTGATLGHTSSSPSLLAAGSLGVDDPNATKPKGRTG